MCEIKTILQLLCMIHPYYSVIPWTSSFPKIEKKKEHSNINRWATDWSKMLLKIRTAYVAIAQNRAQNLARNMYIPTLVNTLSCRILLHLFIYGGLSVGLSVNVFCPTSFQILFIFFSFLQKFYSTFLLFFPFRWCPLLYL